MLELKNISKSYKGKPALHPLTLRLEPGVYGLLGPNGAGKSTMMNIITDNLLPDTGEVLWKDQSVKKLGRNYRRILGFTPQQQGLYDTFTGRRFLHYMAALKEIPKARIAEETERTSIAVNLQDELDKKLPAYSGGMKQRILIAQALLGTPELLVMDEPTAGLDPKERVRVRSLLESIAGDKVILVATHVVSDIEGIAKEILLLKKGNIMAKSTPQALCEEYSQNGILEDVYMHFFEEEENHAETPSL